MSARTLLMAAATAGPPGASLNLSFMSGTLNPLLTFTRASTATYFDATGTMQTAATNAPRFDYDPLTHALRGLLIEEQRTNLLLNTAALGTQGVAVTAQAYTLSFYGTGTVTMSGAFAGSLVGTGAFPTRVQTTFTPAAGTLTCTVTGSVLNAQLEAGVFNTSYIPTTAASVTRSADALRIPAANMSWFTAGGSWMVEFIDLDTVAHSQLVIGEPAGSGHMTPMYVNASFQLGQWDGTGIENTTNTVALGAVSKGATTAAAGTGTICLNGGAVASASFPTGYAEYATSGVGFLVMSTTPSENMGAGYIRRVRYWPRVLSNAEMQSVTI